MVVPIAYDLLRIIWWALLGLLLIGFAVMDGFDLGIGMLLPFVGRNDIERRITINTVGPVWEGNQVWLILGGGAAFAAWPQLYAVSFSGFYIAMFIVLASLIVRPVGFTFRAKIDHPRWRAICDGALFIAGFVPALVFGVALGNLMVGLPFRFDDSLRMSWSGGFFDLLTPFPLLCGLVSVAMLVMHGGVYLALKSDGMVAARAARFASFAAVALILLFTLAGIWVATGIDGQVLATGTPHGSFSNPLAKQVTLQSGAWLNNYGIHHWLLLAPLLGYGGAVAALLALRGQRPGLGFVASAFSVGGVVATFGVSIFPFLLPSALDPRSGLTVWDASSSQLTLFIMLIGTVIFLPIVLLYTAFVFRVLRGKVTAAQIEADPHGNY